MGSQYIAECVNLKLKLLALTLVDDRKSKKYVVLCAHVCVCVLSHQSLTHRIGHIETTNITAAASLLTLLHYQHRPADNGVTLVVIMTHVWSVYCTHTAFMGRSVQ